MIFFKHYRYVFSHTKAKFILFVFFSFLLLCVYSVCCFWNCLVSSSSVKLKKFHRVTCTLGGIFLQRANAKICDAPNKINLMLFIYYYFCFHSFLLFFSRSSLCRHVCKKKTVYKVFFSSTSINYTSFINSLLFA